MCCIMAVDCSVHGSSQKLLPESLVEEKKSVVLSAVHLGRLVGLKTHICALLLQPAPHRPRSDGGPEEPDAGAAHQ